MKKTLTVPEAATELGISERACWQRIYRKQIPFRRWGRKILISKAELDRFLLALPGVSADEAVAKIHESGGGDV